MTKFLMCTVYCSGVIIKNVSSYTNNDVREIELDGLTRNTKM